MATKKSNKKKPNIEDIIKKMLAAEAKKKPKKLSKAELMKEIEVFYKRDRGKEYYEKNQKEDASRLHEDYLKSTE